MRGDLIPGPVAPQARKRMGREAGGRATITHTASVLVSKRICTVLIYASVTSASISNQTSGGGARRGCRGAACAKRRKGPNSREQSRGAVLGGRPNRGHLNNPWPSPTQKRGGTLGRKTLLIAEAPGPTSPSCHCACAASQFNTMRQWPPPGAATTTQSVPRAHAGLAHRPI